MNRFRDTLLNSDPGVSVSSREPWFDYLENVSIVLFRYKKMGPKTTWYSYVRFDISTRFVDTGVRNISKNTPPLIWGKYCRDCSVQGRLSIPTGNKHFKRILTQVKTFLRPLAPDKLFSKSFFIVFLRTISKTVPDIEKCVGSNL